MHLRAYAKINLTLEVLGRRNDGYHEVVTILQNVGLYDVLHIEPAPSMYLTCSADRLAGRGQPRLASRCSSTRGSQRGRWCADTSGEAHSCCHGVGRWQQ